jgi:release factor glutamine methyltransferase
MPGHHAGQDGVPWAVGDAAGGSITIDSVVAALRVAGCVFAEAEADLIIEAAGGRRDVVDELVARRCEGEPLELVVGFAELAGVRVRVQPGVFVPRRRSERLVTSVASRLKTINRDDPVLVDLGCGSAALLLAVLAQVDRALTAYAIDNSPIAVACARENLRGRRAEVLEGAGLAALPAHLTGRVDVIMANLPYVPTAAIPLLPREARLYEPQSTLDGGVDGLDPLRAALAAASTWLHAAGHYLGELHESQVDAAAALAAEHGLAFEASVDPDDGTAVIDLFRDGTGSA